MKKIKHLICLLAVIVALGLTGCVSSLSKELSSYADEVQLPQEITEDITFPSGNGEVTIKWASSNPNVINNEGKITRGVEDQTVSIKAIFNKDTYYLTKTYVVTVKAIGDETLNDAYKQLVVDEVVMANITLITNIGDVTISWESSNTDYISNTGIVTLDDEEHEVVLTATLTYQGASITKEFTVTVAKNDADHLGIALSNLHNYEMVIKYPNQTETLKVGDDGVALTRGNITYYYKTNEQLLIVQAGSNIKYHRPADSDYQSTLNVAKIPTFDFSKINSENYIYENENYVCTNLDEAKNFFGSEQITSFMIKLEGNAISKVVVADSSAFYELELTNHGLVTITYPQEPLELTPLTEIKEHAGKTVKTKGIITNITDKGFYLSDGTNSIFVNYTKSDLTSLLPGIVLEVEGMLTFGEVYQMECENYQISSGSFPSRTTELFRLTNINNYFGLKVDLLALQVVSTQEKDNLVLTATDGTNTYNIYLYDVARNYTQLKTIIDSYSKDDIIMIKGAVIGYEDDYCITISSQSTISPKSSFKPTLRLSEDEVNVKIGEEREAILNSINVYYYISAQEQYLLEDSLYSVSGSFDSSKEGTITQQFTFLTMEATLSIEVTEALKVETLKDVSIKYNLPTGIPSTGDVKILVIPVTFTDRAADSNAVSNLNKAFFGTPQETGWHSLKSYYESVSYGKLSISGTVLQPYNTNRTGRYYSNQYDQGYDPCLTIMEDALDYYDNQIDYNDYDADKDGYIDCVYLIYMGSISMESGSDFWWAYTSSYEDMSSTPEYDNLQPYFYIYAGYEFIYDDFYMFNGTTKSVDINAVTYIHETGHALGLDDYYDYDENKGPGGGLGGADMMDYNYADHNSFSKAILGWITPTVVNKTTTLTLNKFESSGEAVIVANNWNNSYFGEYFIIDYYTPTGINAFIQDGRTNYLSFEVFGLRIYHVDARISSNPDYIYDIYQYNNSYTSHKLIRLIEADQDNGIETDSFARDSDIFTKGTNFTNPKWYDGKSANFTVSIVEQTEDAITFTITIN